MRRLTGVQQHCLRLRRSISAVSSDSARKVASSMLQKVPRANQYYSPSALGWQWHERNWFSRANSTAIDGANAVEGDDVVSENPGGVQTYRDTVAYEITQSLRPKSWRSAGSLPDDLRELIVTNTQSHASATNLHSIFRQLCEDLQARTSHNLTRHHPDGEEMKVNPTGISLPPFVYHPAYTTAFTAYRAPINYSILETILKEISLRRPEFVPRDILDFGSGCGVAAWAADEVWPQSLQG